ncbi:unnamed protein product [Pleuronectes platessa]|uniref:Uncharacterized protein n=1 Tax=Pleuronectes platessa TaxID=8262 RepID=A0A9N7UCK9_PLEPL|nr:unnamed protein product [Pleuronectes platessa]
MGLYLTLRIVSQIEKASQDVFHNGPEQSQKLESAQNLGEDDNVFDNSDLTCGTLTGRKGREEAHSGSSGEGLSLLPVRMDLSPAGKKRTLDPKSSSET